MEARKRAERRRPGTALGRRKQTNRHYFCFIAITKHVKINIFIFYLNRNHVQYELVNDFKTVVRLILSSLVYPA
jgi:hypothetical protein